ncbi:Homoserine O-acetyltransferase [Phytophthora nicotianae]|uniref:Homoserine O-acetyltransferase n=1 Tax=Phytophthora nicotianae TaxID=4792 RepID=A0A0W8DBX4_PHYNI|nr:Homoserine O-acetyltransferase [Phytophthora nicotianae]
MAVSSVAVPALQEPPDLEAVDLDSQSETCSTTSSFAVRVGATDEDCKYKLKQQGNIISKYGEIGYFAMGHIGSVIVNTALVISQTGFCIAYLIFIASNAHKFLDVSKQLVVSVCVPPLVGFSLLRHMRELAYVALLADFMCILGLLVVLNIDLSYMDLDHDYIEPMGVVSAIPFFFGVASYCFEGVGMVLPLENSMRNKHNFMPILVCTVVIITSLYATFGICGYLAFGNDTNAVITLNFEGSGGLVTLVKIFLCLGLFFTYPVMLFPVFEVLQPMVACGNKLENPQTTQKKGILLRAGIVLLTAVVAAGIPGQKRNTRLGDMYAALGIEDDGDSSDNSKDEDYLVEEEEEEEEDIHEAGKKAFHTEQSYEARYDELKKYCKISKKQAFFAYFEKNWNSCRAMWSNYARGKHFTAGNTTTNRIESNWKYLKMLLGRKTRIDRTIAGFLQHQMTITRQIVTEIGQQHSTSRMLNTIPKFLRAVARRISSHVLERVKKEWERFVDQMEKTTCERRSSSHQWKVYFLHYVYECDELDWTCTCLFYSSNHLPCCHLMHVANQGNGFQALPGMSIDERWSTFEALDFKEELSSAADTLQPIVNMSKLKLPKQKLRLPDETGSTESKRKPTDLETEKEVVFVRLRRNERANQVVLSSAEKYSYAKAMLEPLLQHLSELSSADYYQELSAWKETVDIGLRVGEKGTFVSSNDEGGEDEDTKAGNFSLLDPVEAMGTACLMETLETSADSADITDDSSDGETVPPTQPSEITKETPKDSSDENLQDEGDGKDMSIDVNASHASVAPPARQVDIISVPKPKGQGRPRTTTKQLRQTKIATRLAVHKYPSNLTVQLDEFVIWARNTSNLKVVADMMDKYPIQLEDAYLSSRTIQCSWEAMRTGTYMHPFVIPADLTRSMEAAIKDAKNAQRGPGPLADKIKKQGIGLDIVASIDPKLWKFSG